MTVLCREAPGLVFPATLALDMKRVFFYAVFIFVGKALRFQCRGADGRGGRSADDRTTADIEQQFIYALRTFGLQGEGQSFAMRAFADGAAAAQSAEACALCLRAYYANDASLVAAVFEPFAISCWLAAIFLNPNT